MTPTRILIPVADAYEDLEAWYPRLRLEAAGVHVVVASPDGKGCRGKHGYPMDVHAALGAVDPRELDGVVVPGGWAPDVLRRHGQLLEVVRDMDARGKLVAAICHGPWVLVSARILKGRRVTGSAGVRDDVENAGALWRDDPVVVDGNLVTSRRPPDLPAFGEALVKFLHRG
ncbi:MAG: type 1 glutamine amidotransferase [Deltaproteobacteria bacterium]|nr:type 1 glutamine amidotransferase [Deltaproteobacteria bacterium]